MTGKRKNEHIDIVSQAQLIVDEYEEKYFKCLGDAFLKEKKIKKRRNILLAAFVILALTFAAAIKMLM